MALYRPDPVTPDPAWLWRQIDAMRRARGLRWTELARSLDLPPGALAGAYLACVAMPHAPIRAALWRFAPRTVGAWCRAQPLPGGLDGQVEVLRQAARRQLDLWLTGEEMAGRLGVGRAAWSHLLLGRVAPTSAARLYRAALDAFPDLAIYRDRHWEGYWAGWSAGRRLVLVA